MDITTRPDKKEGDKGPFRERKIPRGDSEKTAVRARGEGTESGRRVKIVTEGKPPEGQESNVRDSSCSLGGPKI